MTKMFVNYITHTKREGYDNAETLVGKRFQATSGCLKQRLLR